MRPLSSFTTAAFLFLIACGSDPSGEGSGDGDDDGDFDSGFDRAPALGNVDLTIFEKIKSGQLSAKVGLAQITMGNGLPIASETGFLFVRPNTGGPHFLAGDHNNWESSPLTIDATAGIQFLEVEITSPDGSLYKFVDDRGAFIADPLSRRYGFDEFGEFSIVVASGAHRERWPIVTPNDSTLVPRTVRAWVPSQTTPRHIYANDGQNLFDPNANFGGWRLDESAPVDVLVVGIDNTSNRFYEYTPNADDFGNGQVGGNGTAYASFVANEVLPLVEARYGAAGVRAVMGSSLGGLSAYHQALLNPSLFQLVASLSGTMGWGSIGNINGAGNTILQRFEEAAKLPAILYLDSGGVDGGGCVDDDADGVNDDSNDSDNYCTNRQFANLLAANGYTFEVDLFHWHELGAAHNEAAWAARVTKVWERLSALSFVSGTRSPTGALPQTPKAN